MSKLKILQLASFRGNIGDNANVSGTRRMLRQNLGCELEFTDLEYLEYEPDPAWGGKKFDEDFARLANEHDMLLIGGGGFFELAVDASCSGTPLNIPVDILKQIKVPVVFYALGFHVLYGINEERKEKFRRYLDYLLTAKNILVSVRNDGSLEKIHELYGEEYSKRIFKCPDGGFFTVVKDSAHIELPAEKKTIVIQLAGDGLYYRFNQAMSGNNNEYLDKFLSSLAENMRALFRADSNTNVILVPHIPEDLHIINEFIRHIGAPYSRKNITVAPYIHGPGAQEYIFDLYSKANLVIGMRFHANVCPIGLNVPTIGLVTYEQIGDLYAELGIPERSIEVNTPQFREDLYKLIITSLNDSEKVKEQYRLIKIKLQSEINNFHHIVRSFMNGKKRFLFNTQFVWPFSPVDYGIASALQKQGHEVLMVACGGLPEYCELQTNKQARPSCEGCTKAVTRDFEKFGLPYIKASDFIAPEDILYADMVSDAETVEELLQKEVYGIAVGKLARLNLFQYYHGYPFEITGEKEEVFRRCIHTAILLVFATQRIFEMYKPDMSVTVNGKFLQWAPFVEFAKAEGIPYATWEDLDQEPSGVILAVNDIAHEQRIDKVWNEESKKLLDEQERVEVLKHWKLWADGEISIFPYYDETTVHDEQKIRAMLGIDKPNPIVACYSNVSWDSTSIGFESAFKDMYDWLFNVVDYAKKHPEMYFVIRTHPAEIKVPEHFKNEVLTCDAIKKYCNNLPENLKLIEPDSPISSYALSNMAVVNMVYTSTMGIELAVQGKRPWIAANAYYSKKGFSTDIESPEHMVNLLDQKVFKNKLSEDEIKLAEKFSQIVRLRRVFSFPFLDSAKGKFNVDSPADLDPGKNFVLNNICNYLHNGSPMLDIGKLNMLNEKQDRVNITSTAKVKNHENNSASLQKFDIIKADPVLKNVYDAAAVKRFDNTIVELSGLKILNKDLLSFYIAAKDIFLHKIYDFNTTNHSPVIIDGGGHIGLFTLYIKNKYPDSRITVFEPDDESWDILNYNLKVNNISNANLVKAGLYNFTGEMNFGTDHSDGSSIFADNSTSKINVVKLSDYISGPVDFLKLNIEGAELPVLIEAEHKLHLVNEIVIEYHGFPEVGQNLHKILEILDRNGFRYLVNDFDEKTNPATKPPFRIDSEKKFFLLIYAKRIYTDKKYSPKKEEPGQIRFSPVSRQFGFDRGTPIDRVLIGSFLKANENIISGHVLEIGDDGYTREFGKDVISGDILNYAPSEIATIVGDLSTGENIPANYFDCFIMTQTFNVIYDYKATLKNAFKSLKPGGSLLVTVPGISQISRYDMDRWGDYWRFTKKSLEAIIKEVIPDAEYQIESKGNVYLAKAFLDGLAASEIDADAYNYNDEDYQLLITAIIKKKPLENKTEKKEGSAVVFLYHRVANDPIDSQLLAVSPQNFDSQLTRLKNCFNIVPLSDIVQNKNLIQPGTAAITFDDGYADNLIHALPLLEKHQVHATIFVSSGLVGSTDEFWWDKIERVFLDTYQLPELLKITIDGTEQTWNLSDPDERLRAFNDMHKVLISQGAKERDEFLRSLYDWAGISHEGRVTHRIVTEEQLRKLAASPYIEIGAHTTSHIRLSSLDAEGQKKEILNSKNRIEEIINKPVRLFSYPFGTQNDFNETSKSILKNNGFTGGIANFPGVTDASTDRYAIPRILIRNWDDETFVRWLKAEKRGVFEIEMLNKRDERFKQLLGKC